MKLRNRDCTLRPATVDDHDAIAEIWHGSASLPDVGPPFIPTVEELRERVGREIASGWNVTVAIHRNEPAGFLATKPREAVLSELFVRPGFIGLGIGRALLAHAMTTMPDGFTLYTRSANARARRFYEKAGLVYLRDDAHPRTGDPIAHYGWKSG